MTPHFRRAGAAAVVAVPLAHPLCAQLRREKIEREIVRRIRDERLNRAAIDAMALSLLDVIGPWLTGSPALKQANEGTALVPATSTN